MFMTPLKKICEYIWIGGDGEIRSKTRVLSEWIIITPTEKKNETKIY